MDDLNAIHLDSDKDAKSSDLKCRICLSGSSRDKMVTPCKCKGSIALVHRHCLEKWLGIRSADSCELCKAKLPLIKTPKTFKEWLVEGDSKNKWYLVADIACFIVLTPITVINLWMCIEGLMYHTQTVYEKSALAILIGLLLLSFVLWLLVCSQHHRLAYVRWKQSNFKVVVILPKCADTKKGSGRSVDPPTVQSGQTALCNSDLHIYSLTRP